MIPITITSKGLLEHDLDAYVYLLEHEFDFATLSPVAKTLYPPLEMAVKQRGFSGRAGSSLILTGSRNGKGVYIILLGLGDVKAKQIKVEAYRRAIGQLVRIAETHKINSLGLSLPDPARLGLSYKRLAQETSTILHKASYHFDEFITVPDKKLSWKFEAVLVAPQEGLEDARFGNDQGICIAEAINTARYWCDLPPSNLTPPVFAQYAQDIADHYGLKATIFDKKDIIKMGMGGLEGVARGSMHEPRLAILEYKAPRADAPTLALVGKGVTFDSGGLSIKPAQAMETMKDDMAGAAVVLATMKVIAQFKPDIHVVALAPMAENMPSGTAIKPGDILRFYNGKTAEVKNTDAEGRLILADALSYAVKHYKPDAIVDLATLTGACAHALGSFYAGLLSQHDELSHKIEKASKHSGDRVWRLPMDNDYKPAIKSDVADICNSGNPTYKAGAITAAFFLQQFVDEVPWVHLDIAGTAFGVPDMSYLRPGATGFGIRLLIDLIMHWHKD
jgi:leucyl aminopeptidase